MFCIYHRISITECGKTRDTVILLLQVLSRFGILTKYSKNASKEVNDFKFNTVHFAGHVVNTKLYFKYYGRIDNLVDVFRKYYDHFLRMLQPINRLTLF